MKRYVIFLTYLALIKAEIDWSQIESPMPAVYQPMGYPNSYKDPTHRVVGGEEAEKNAFPYQAGLFINSKDGKSYFCGGSVLTKRFILTAAHCMKEPLMIEVVLGAHNIRENEETQQRYNSTKFMAHENYDSSTMVNDVALIELPETITLTDAIQTIKLPRLSDVENDFVGVNATVSGWGRTSDNATGISDVLYQTSDFIITNEFCDSEYFGLIEDVHICMNGKEKRSACNGDSGGPLITLNKDNKPIQIGIVSFGIVFGCEVGWPSAYTRVTEYLDWISKNSDVILEK